MSSMSLINSNGFVELRLRLAQEAQLEKKSENKKIDAQKQHA